MCKRPILMFSGGVDSTVCLNLLKKQNPILFYVQTLKMQWDTPRVQELAHKISPKSPFYTFFTNTKDYNASFDLKAPKRNIYYICLIDNEWFYPLKYEHTLALGYFKHRGITKRGRILPEGQEEFIDKVELYHSDKFLLPLSNMKSREIEELASELPFEKLVVSSTRSYYPRFMA